MSAKHDDNTSVQVWVGERESIPLSLWRGKGGLLLFISRSLNKKMGNVNREGAVSYPTVPLIWSTRWGGGGGGGGGGDRHSEKIN